MCVVCRVGIFFLRFCATGTCSFRFSDVLDWQKPALALFAVAAGCDGAVPWIGLVRVWVYFFFLSWFHSRAAASCTALPSLQCTAILGRPASFFSLLFLFVLLSSFLLVYTPNPPDQTTHISQLATYDKTDFIRTCPLWGGFKRGRETE